MNYLYLLLAVSLSITTAHSRFVLKGRISDSNFENSKTIEIEILESGQKIETSYGEDFEIELPNDETWNVCLRDDEIENCYVVETSAASKKDSTVVGELVQKNKLEVYTTFLMDREKDNSPKEESNLPGAVVDQNVKSAEIEKMTRLRKMIVNVKKRPKRSLGQSTVSAKNIKRMPGLAEADVVKAIQALPGVVASSDFSSKIYVRGGGADQNLFLFDNGVVFSPVHFFGLFSTFLVEGIDKVDFYKGGFAPEFGNRLSSVVDITSRPGGEEADTVSYKGSVNVSTFASTVNLETSYKKTRLNFSARATYLKEMLELLRDLELTTVNLNYRFYDLQGSWYQEINENHKFSFSFYEGEDNLVFTPINLSWGNEVYPFNYFWRMNSHWNFAFTAAHSMFEQAFTLENIQDFKNEIQADVLKPKFTYRTEGSEWNFGAEVKYMETLFSSQAQIVDIEQIDRPHFWLISPFVENLIELDPIELKYGVRFNYVSSIEEFSAEPRFSLRYNLNKKEKIDFHVGYYKQFINSILFGDFETINEFYYPVKKELSQEILPTNSLLLSLGYQVNEVFDQYDVTVEAYYKNLNNLIVFDPYSKPDSIINDPKYGLGDYLFRGEGYSMGTEFSLRKTKGPIQGGLSYSFGYSIVKEGESVFPAKWDMPHAVKMDGTINWRGKKDALFAPAEKDTYFRSSVQIKYSSGLPYTEVLGYLPTHFIDQSKGQPAGGPNPSLSGNVATPYAGRNESRYPAYNRVDLKVVDWGVEDSWNFSWTLLNIFDRENVFSYAYNTNLTPPERTTITQFPFFPMLVSYQQYF